MATAWLRVYRSPEAPTATSSASALDTTPPAPVATPHESIASSEPMSGSRVRSSARVAQAPVETTAPAAEPTEEIDPTSAVATEPEPEINDDPNSEPIGGTKSAVPAAAAEFAPEDGAMQTVLAVYPKAKLDAALKRGQAAFETLLEMANDELNLYGQPAQPSNPQQPQPGVQPQQQQWQPPQQQAVQPQPVQQQPQAPAAQAIPQAIAITPELESQMISDFGEEPYNKAIKPLISQVNALAPLAQQFQHAMGLVQQLAKVTGDSWFDQRVDAFTDSKYGSTFEDLTPQQAASRQELRTNAESIFQVAQRSGKQMSASRAVAIARHNLARTTATAEATQKLQQQVVDRNKRVGAVPARSSSPATARELPRGPERVAASRAKYFADRGMVDPDPE